MSYLAQLEQQGLDLLEQSIRDHEPEQVWALFSGGHDSVVSTHLAAQHPRFSGVVHIDTGTGIGETEEYVKELCDRFGWPLRIYRARENVRGDGTPDPMIYEDMVRQHGFPGPNGHTWIFNRLKDRAIGRLGRDSITRRGNRMALVTGVRKQESGRRLANISRSGVISKRGSRVWTNVIAEMTGGDCNSYMKRYDIPRNPVRDILGFSAECLCGAMGDAQQWEIIVSCYPDDPNVQMINRLHDEVTALGFPWGWGEEPPEHWKHTQAKGELYARWMKTQNTASKAQDLMCHNCNNRGSCSVTEAIANPGYVFSSAPTVNVFSEPTDFVEAIASPVDVTADTTTTQNFEEQTMTSSTTQGQVFQINPAALGGFGYTFTAMEGKQGGKPFYASVMPLSSVVELLKFDESAVPEDERVQRPLNEKRAEEIAAYMLRHQPHNDPDYHTDWYTYVLGGLCAAISQPDAQFIPYAAGMNVGLLRTPRIRVLLDGQHRKGGIALAISDLVALGYDSITVTFYLTNSVQEEQHLFSVLNRYARKPSGSDSKFRDQDDAIAELTRRVRMSVLPFRALTELSSNTISAKSVKLFTFSGLYNANLAAVSASSLPDEVLQQFLTAYWNAIANQIPEWSQIFRQEVNPKQIRENYIHHLEIALIALGRLAGRLLEDDGWESKVQRLSDINWSRSNPLWADMKVLTPAGKVPKSKGQAISYLSAYLNEVAGVA